jgi:hypothetical protein
MTMTLEQFREAVSAQRGDRRRGGGRYRKELVAFAVDFAQQTAADGKRLPAAAKMLGISAMTLRAWCEQAPTGPRRRLREVRIEPSIAGRTSAITLTTSAGHVVQGLDVEQAIILLRGLS